MIRTTNNLVRILLFQAHLPPHFWVEVLHLATYLLNILPSSAINKETLHFRLYNTKPNYSNLRVFGCLCYPHLDTPHKLALLLTPYIFLRYPSNHRGYRCLDLASNKIIISRNVTCDETIFPYGSITPNHAPSYTFLDNEPNIIARQLLANSYVPHPTPSAQTQNEAQPDKLPPTQSLPNPTLTHPMVTHFQLGKNKPPSRLNLNVSTISPTPKSFIRALNELARCYA